jgi:hypothetical protein
MSVIKEPGFVVDDAVATRGMTAGVYPASWCRQRTVRGPYRSTHSRWHTPCDAFDACEWSPTRTTSTEAARRSSASSSAAAGCVTVPPARCTAAATLASPTWSAGSPRAPALNSRLPRTSSASQPTYDHMILRVDLMDSHGRWSSASPVRHAAQ